MGDSGRALAWHAGYLQAGKQAEAGVTYLPSSSGVPSPCPRLLFFFSCIALPLRCVSAPKILLALLLACCKTYAGDHELGKVRLL